MPSLEILVSSKEPGLTTVGEIHRSPLNPRQPPVVTDVIARNSRAARFALDPGDYSYHFHVEQGAGEFSVIVRGAGDDAPLDSDDFDTEYGFYGRVFSFTVQP
jgi:hypothetical protein